jgi:hypothetical protein
MEWEKVKVVEVGHEGCPRVHFGPRSAEACAQRNHLRGGANPSISEPFVHAGPQERAWRSTPLPRRPRGAWR